MAHRAVFAILMVVCLASSSLAQSVITTLNMPAGPQNTIGNAYSFSVVGTSKDNSHTTYAFQKAQPTTTAASASGIAALTSLPSTKTGAPGTMVLGPTEVVVHSSHPHHGKLTESCHWLATPSQSATCVVRKLVTTGTLPVQAVEVTVTPHSGTSVIQVRRRALPGAAVAAVLCGLV